MSNIFKKWKDALQNGSIEGETQIQTIDTTGIRADVSASLEPYNVIRRLKDLEDWQKSFADPSIRGNLKDITNIYEKTAGIKNQIEKEIVPKINEAVSTASTAATNATNAANIATSASDAASQALASAKDVAAKVKKAAEDAIAANKSAQNALSYINNIFKRLKNTASNLSTEINKMTAPINYIVKNIGYLDTDLEEIQESLRIGFLKLPDPIGAAIHLGEALYHLIVINSNMKGVLLGFKDRLFPSMQSSLY
ncbi:MAG: hypothetical protein ACFFG0_34265 [Candidatus Thorarchaeota archaeon]